MRRRAVMCDEQAEAEWGQNAAEFLRDLMADLKARKQWLDEVQARIKQNEREMR